MSLGLNLGLWGNASGGGVLSPAEPDLILQWLVDYDGDFELVDSVGVLDKVEVTDVPVASFDGTQNVETTGRFDGPQKTGVFKIAGWVNPTSTSVVNRKILGTARVSGDVGTIVTIRPDNRFILQTYGAVSTVINNVYGSALALNTGKWNHFEFIGDGVNVTLTVNGASETKAITGTFENVDSTFPLWLGNAPTITTNGLVGRFSGLFFECDECPSLNYPCTTIPFYDVSVINGVPNSNHAISAPSTDPTIITDDEIGESYELRYGYTGNVPALNELVGGERLDALNLLPIENKGSVDGERVHNGYSATIRTTDPIYTSGTINFFSADGATADKKTFADFQAHPNGKYGLYLQSSNQNTGSAGNCHLFKSGQYPFDYAPDPSGLKQQNKYWTVCDSFAPPLIPYPIDSGDGIGPNGGWYPVDGDKVYLVEDS